MPKRVFFPYLDTLRFVAFMLVFICHFFVTCEFTVNGNDIFHDIIRLLMTLCWKGGAQGVHIFFVLSGFLITYLMVEETKKTGTVAVIHFYIRRILRIWPIYYLFLFLMIFLLPRYIPSSFHHDDHNRLAQLTLLANFDPSMYNFNIYNPIGIIWSICVEEQFYVFFPVYFLFAFAKLRRYYILTATFVAASIICFYLYNEQGEYSTYTNIWFLMLGSMGAYSINRDNDRFGLITVVRKYRLLIIILTLLIYPGIAFAATRPATSVLLGFLYLLAIIDLCFSDIRRSRIYEVTNKLGKYTYGMYLYHWIVLKLVIVVFDKLRIPYQNNFKVYPIIGILGLGGTIIVSYLSYRYFERLFLKLKDKYAIIISGTPQ